MKETEDYVGDKRIRFVLIQEDGNPSEKFYETFKIDTSELASTKNLTSEENKMRAITDVNGEDNDSESGHREILLSDTEEKSITICDDYSVAEEFPFPDTDYSSWDESESMSKNESEEKSSSMESSFSSASSTDEEDDDSLTQSLMTSTLSTEEEDESSVIQSTDEGEEEDEEDDDDHEDDGGAIGKSEDSSNRTWTSSIESKAGAVSPEEMVEALSSESKDMNLSSQIPEEKNNGDCKTRVYCCPKNDNNGGAENVRVIKNKKKVEGFGIMRRKIWGNPILVLILLFFFANALFASFSFYLPRSSPVIR